jgi:hypothetical protein
MRKKKPTSKRNEVSRTKAHRTKKAAVSKGSAAAKRLTPGKKKARTEKPVRARGLSAALAELELKGRGSEPGGQSGDLQGLSRVAAVNSESVEELAEEGQAFEAELIDAVENAPDDDPEEVTTREVPADDVPPEYFED